MSWQEGGMSDARCEYCGREERYGHNAVCVMNTVEELRAEIERLREAGNNAFMAMCAFRDSSTIGKDEEVFQDAIDALGAALAGKEGNPRL